MLLSQTGKNVGDGRALGFVLTKITTNPTILHTEIPYAVVMWWVIAILCATLAWLLGASRSRVIITIRHMHNGVDDRDVD
jgi:hypothetical protein